MSDSTENTLRRGGTIGHLLARAFQRRGDAEMLVGDGERLSYAQMADRTARMITVLQSLGLVPGSATPETAAEARYRIEGLHLRRTDGSGQPRLELQAAKAEWFDDDSSRLHGVQARGLSGAAAPWQLSAPVGEGLPGRTRFRLLPPVEGAGRWPDGEALQLSAQTVWVDAAAQRFSSTEPLRIHSATRQAQAAGFTAGFDGRQLTFTTVEMRYALPD